MSLIGILIALIILAIIIYAIYLVVGMLHVPQPIQTLIWLLIAAIFLIIILDLVTGGGGSIGSLKLR